MVTGLSYEDVPDFVSAAESWTGALRKWLQTNGLTFVIVGKEIAEVPHGSCSIEIGLSAAGCYHAVAVAQERLDPDPLERGFLAHAKHKLVILPLVTQPDLYT